jgi:serine/threonine protein kinase HipA of HipAB toxin-antitoxin module
MAAMAVVLSPMAATSAGGARAKAVIAWNRETNEVRSGQVAAGEGFTYWLLKFDGLNGNKNKELIDPEFEASLRLALADRRAFRSHERRARVHRALSNPSGRETPRTGVTQ